MSVFRAFKPPSGGFVLQIQGVVIQGTVRSEPFKDPMIDQEGIYTTKTLTYT